MARRGGGKQVELTIDGLGARGDGVAHLDGQPVFVPFALPGERVVARVTGRKSAGPKAEVLEVLAESPSRVEPVCPHFGPCGGCSVQHLAPEAYRRWKREQVDHALQREGVPADGVEAPVTVPPQTRRRATLAARAAKNGVHLGFHGRETHRIETITACHVLRPALVALLPGLRDALGHAMAPGARGGVTLLEADDGVDVLVRTPRPPELRARETLAATAERHDLARITWLPSELDQREVEPEPVAIRRPPVMRFAGIPVEPPPGGFLQPTAAGEAALVDAVTRWLPSGNGVRLADFYAGCGTFTFPLAKQARVHAVEGEPEAIASLWQAARRNDLDERVSADVGDLAESPPTPDELNAFDGVVFDPPRAGAKALARSLAASRVQVVAAVSCNAATFARDARALIDGGYTLETVRPVDQFPWSGHVELAARFVRR